MGEFSDHKKQKLQLAQIFIFSIFDDEKVSQKDIWYFRNTSVQ